MAVLSQIKEMIFIIERTKRKEIGHSKQEFPIYIIANNFAERFKIAKFASYLPTVIASSGQ